MKRTTLKKKKQKKQKLDTDAEETEVKSKSLLGQTNNVILTTQFSEKRDT